MARTKANQGRLSGRLESMCRDAQELLDATEGKVDAKSKEVRERLQASLDTIREEYDLLENRVSEGIQAADHTIREKPYQALGITFAAGLIFGWILNRK
ncbi:MAG: hypothetical protein K9M82_11130 [Deltaproteobacteria bacterium]|nr:hypothetical protein [Deltaproteobacteria bacterium]